MTVADGDWGRGLSMEKRLLGPNGLAVSRLGLGTSTWGFTTDRDEAARQLTSFVGVGGNLVDTGYTYGAGRSEEILGELLQSTVRRSEVFVATKAVFAGKPPFQVDASRSSILAQLDESLRRLRTDHVDLWQMHAWDRNTPFEETMDALTEAVVSGRARAVGVCNYSGWQTAVSALRLRDSATLLLTSTQVEYSLLQRNVEREVLPAARQFSLGVLAWGALGRGALTGKYQAGIPDDRKNSPFFNHYVRPYAQGGRARVAIDAVVDIARELDATPLAVALAWVRDRRSVTAALVGARTSDQLQQSLAADAFEIPADIRERLDKLTKPEMGYPERPMGT
jgi:aryl-alcohol dehydrogenase-like predicted oxidoreductase